MKATSTDSETLFSHLLTRTVSNNDRSSREGHGDLRRVLLVAMHRLRRESRQANRDVFGAAGKWSRVADPFAAGRDDGLPGRHIQFPGFMLHPQRAPQDYGELTKFRSRARFLPPFRTCHTGNAVAGGDV